MLEIMLNFFYHVQFSSSKQLILRAPQPPLSSNPITDRRGKTRQK